MPIYSPKKPLRVVKWRKICCFLFRERRSIHLHGIPDAWTSSIPSMVHLDSVNCFRLETRQLLLKLLPVLELPILRHLSVLLQSLFFLKITMILAKPLVIVINLLLVTTLLWMVNQIRKKAILKQFRLQFLWLLQLHLLLLRSFLYAIAKLWGWIQKGEKGCEASS